MYSSFLAEFEPLRFKVGPLIGAGYLAIGTPLRYPARMVTITNLTNADLLVTTNPPDDQIVMPASTAKIYDITSNTFTTNMSGIFAFPAGTQFWVKQLEAPTNGKSIFIEVIYGSERQ